MYKAKVKARRKRIQAAFHEENSINISPSKIFEFLIVLVEKFIKKGTLQFYYYYYYYYYYFVFK